MEHQSDYQVGIVTMDSSPPAAASGSDPIVALFDEVLERWSCALFTTHPDADEIVAPYRARLLALLGGTEEDTMINRLMIAKIGNCWQGQHGGWHVTGWEMGPDVTQVAKPQTAFCFFGWAVEALADIASLDQRLGFGGT